MQSTNIYVLKMYIIQVPVCFVGITYFSLTPETDH